MGSGDGFHKGNERVHLLVPHEPVQLCQVSTHDLTSSQVSSFLFLVLFLPQTLNVSLALWLNYDCRLDWRWGENLLQPHKPPPPPKKNTRMQFCHAVNKSAGLGLTTKEKVKQFFALTGKTLKLECHISTDFKTKNFIHGQLFHSRVCFSQPVNFNCQSTNTAC